MVIYTRPLSSCGNNAAATTCMLHCLLQFTTRPQSGLPSVCRCVISIGCACWQAAPAVGEAEEAAELRAKMARSAAEEAAARRDAAAMMQRAQRAGALKP